MPLLPLAGAVQSGSDDSSGTALILSALPVAVSVGDLLVVGVTARSPGGSPTASVTDDLGNTYSQVSAIESGFTPDLMTSLHASKITSSGTPVLTATYSAATDFRRAVAAAFRSSSFGVPSSGYATTGSGTGPVEVDMGISANAGTMVNGIAVACVATEANTPDTVGPSTTWHGLIQTPTTVLQYRAITEFASAPVMLQITSTGFAALQAAGGDFAEDSVAKFFASQGGARHLVVRGGR